MLTAVSFAQPGYSNYCPGTDALGSAWGGVTYEYAYSSAGQASGKRMAITRTGYYGGTVDLDAS